MGPDHDLTCWSLIRDAAAGNAAARERFARIYQPVVKAYLAAQWPLAQQSVDDATQDVFVECFRAGGLLEKADPERAGGFRAFFLGAVCETLPRRHQARIRPAVELPVDLLADDTGPTEAFDRAWARALMKEAARIQEDSANRAGPAAVQRVKLLRLRFHDGLPIRDIARMWGTDATVLHHEYAIAREEFRAALRLVIAFHYPTAAASALDRLAAELLECLG